MESQNYPVNVESALIGSCTNSSYEDMSRAAHIARQAAEAGLELRTPLLVSPGSEQIRATIQRDGQIDAFESAGATVLANACGPCIGQWKREDIEGGQQNTIVTSFNRNFPGRNDANRNTLAFIGSPELVVATAFAGEMGFDPRSDALATADGEFRFSPPTGDELPPNGFDPGEEGFIAPPDDGSAADVVISPESNRLQRLTPFNPWDGGDYTFLSLLLKTRGKTTTDHISPAGSWLRFRGHLENISGNLFSGGVNAFTDGTGTTLNQISGQADQPVNEVARAYKDAGIRWVAVGDENYGEGSSREHASMEIRFSGGFVVIARSFARIAETNLKKQGVLAPHLQRSVALRPRWRTRSAQRVGPRELRSGQSPDPAHRPCGRLKRRSDGQSHLHRRTNHLVPGWKRLEQNRCHTVSPILSCSPLPLAGGAAEG